VPSLGTREAFAFGEGVALPTRLRFSQLGADLIPKSESVSSAEMMDGTRGIDAAFIERVVERWRGATMGTKRKVGDGGMQDNKPGSPNALEAERALLQDAALSLRREPGVKLQRK
jgi:uncharacterized protein